MPAVAMRDLVAEIEGHRILDGLDLAVEEGEWVNIIGPNGAGKTTLLRCVLGTLAHRGVIELNGAEVMRPAERACWVAYVPQTPVIPPGIAVADYVLMGRTPHRGVFSRETDSDLRIATDVLGRLDLGHLAARDVRSLSGGERQRVVLARALSQQAPVLLLDEPTTALDLGHQQEVLDLVESLRNEHGLTVIATLHDLTLAARYGDRVTLLAEGRIVGDGSPASVLTADTIAHYFGATVRIIDDPDGPVIVPALSQRSPHD